MATTASAPVTPLTASCTIKGVQAPATGDFFVKYTIAKAGVCISLRPRVTRAIS